MRLRRLLTAGALAAVAIGALAPTAGAVTTIRNGGSTGLQLLATKLAQEYKVHTHGAVKVTVTGGGSGAGISAVNAGTFDIGNSSRDPRASDPPGLVFYASLAGAVRHHRQPEEPDQEPHEGPDQGDPDRHDHELVRVGWAGGGSDPGLRPDLDVGHVRVAARRSSPTVRSTRRRRLRSRRTDSTGTAVANHKRGIACVTLAVPDHVQGEGQGRQGRTASPRRFTTPRPGATSTSNNSTSSPRALPTGAPLAYLNWVLSKQTQCNVVSQVRASDREVLIARIHRGRGLHGRAPVPPSLP